MGRGQGIGQLRITLAHLLAGIGPAAIGPTIGIGQAPGNQALFRHQLLGIPMPPLAHTPFKEIKGKTGILAQRLGHLGNRGIHI